MFTGHYYHSTIKKMVAVFGTLFNNISVVRKDGTGKVVDISRVPLSYGPKAKFLARIDEQADLEAAKIAIKLPRMSFEMTGMVYDATTKVNRYNTIDKADPSNPAGRLSVRTFSPYRLGMQLSIMAKHQNDALQIVEQILPYFQPEYTVSVKDVEGLDIINDIPIVLTGCHPTEQYEGDFMTRRSTVYTLDFEMRVRFYGPTISQSIIKKVITNFVNKDSGVPLETMVISIDPPTAAETDAYTILQSISFFSDTTSFYLTVQAGAGAYVVGENVEGTTSGSTAEIISIDGSILLVHGATGPFKDGESLSGVTSGTIRALSLITPTYD